MTQIKDMVAFLESLAPLRLAASWDNVGLLVGDLDAPVKKVMTCLTLTSDVLEEGISKKVDLIISHHPFPFRSLKRVVLSDPGGRLIQGLMKANIAVYSAHTAYDSASRGINQQLAEKLKLESVASLRTTDGSFSGEGEGRFGNLTPFRSLEDVAGAVREILRVGFLQLVGDKDRKVARVGIACGSAGEFLDLALAKNCDLFITGELSFHRCLQAEEEGMAVILAGHFHSEKFALASLARDVKENFNDLECWDSFVEKSPLRLFS